MNSPGTRPERNVTLERLYLGNFKQFSRSLSCSTTKEPFYDKQNKEKSGLLECSTNCSTKLSASIVVPLNTALFHVHSLYECPEIPRIFSQEDTLPEASAFDSAWKINPTHDTDAPNLIIQYDQKYLWETVIGSDFLDGATDDMTRDFAVATMSFPMYKEESDMLDVLCNDIIEIASVDSDDLSVMTLKSLQDKEESFPEDGAAGSEMKPPQISAARTCSRQSSNLDPDQPPYTFSENMLIEHSGVVPHHGATEITEHDVLCGKGGSKSCQNGHFRRLCAMYASYYRETKKRRMRGKKGIALRIVNEVHRHHGRFLRQKGPILEEISDEEAAKKVAHCIRDFNRRNRT